MWLSSLSLFSNELASQLWILNVFVQTLDFICRFTEETYSNMCALCEKPSVCDYPDNYSGYEGALRCLAHNGGQVAWTKVIYVKRFFGLPVGVTPAVPTKEDPSNFNYFCPDGTKVPIDATTKPCTWAARPWQGYMTNGQVKNVDAVQKVNIVKVAI